MAAVTEKTVKLVAVGDHGVGKTSLLKTFQTDSFVADVPDVIQEAMPKVVHATAGDVRVDMWDSPGKPEFERLRRLVYANPNCQVVLLCFSVADHATTAGITAKREGKDPQDTWPEEIRTYLSKPIRVPILLVGTKADLPVTVQRPEAEKLAKDIGAVGYFEVSAKNKEGLDQLFAAAVNAALSAKPGQDDKKCCKKCCELQ